jgi:NADP-dependent 3-hydroxy acid dehydrogenase YdfG
VLLADNNLRVLGEAAKALAYASYSVETLAVDVTSPTSVRALADKAAALGTVTQVMNTAGLSPNMASPEKVLEADL